MSKGDRVKPRSVARLAAVQALYQMEVSGVGVDAVVREFSEHRFDRDVDGPDGDQLSPADETFFAELAKGVVAHRGGDRRICRDRQILLRGTGIRFHQRRAGRHRA
jgi:N utilization substance protein B